MWILIWKFQDRHIALISHCVKSVKIRSFFWFVFSCIWTERREIRSISPYSVRMRENTDQKKLRIWTLFTQWVVSVSAVAWLFLCQIFIFRFISKFWGFISKLNIYTNKANCTTRFFGLSLSKIFRYSDSS